MSKFSRRNFLGGLTASGVVAATTNTQAKSAINRRALVQRHNPTMRAIDLLSPLSVGNGEFAFTADLTGLQTFPELYEKKMSLCTMSQWGWHTIPSNFDRKDLRLTEFDTFGRKVGYAVNGDGQKELFNWLRENPHRLHLGQIGFQILKADRRPAQNADLTNTEQTLDLWSGILTSKFALEGVPVRVQTAAHPSLDLLAVTIDSPLLAQGRLAVRFAFPYGSGAMHAADWTQARKHKSALQQVTLQQAEIARTLDADQYFVNVAWSANAAFKQTSQHEFVLSTKAQQLSFTAHFSAQSSKQARPSAQATLKASEKFWQQFWSTGGALELSASTDARAQELERRIVLSQYLTTINCAGSLPPQETGLTVNSWYGKFHLEMHWWHTAHFALWGRLPLFERSLQYYDDILPQAQSLARSQGYAGARWPKMTSRDGLDSPSSIGPLLIWQQPHPIFYAELCYRQRPTKQTLRRYESVVAQTAEFMASFAHFNPATKRFDLGPPVIPAQENHPPRETWNPTFELSYWIFALKIAQQWRERLGMNRLPEWDRVIAQLAPLPVRDGVYLAHENCPQTFTQRNHDHPSMLGALGMLPGDGVNHEIMRRTLKRALSDWRWDETWGWDYPLTAMTAARLGEQEIAVDSLLMKTAKNHYAANGHNYQRENLPCYLPGNGGLLYAAAMMAAGWNGAPKIVAPGFPQNNKWKVRWENLAQTL